MPSSIFVGTSTKVGLQDLEKAKHYIDMIIERDYADEAKDSSVEKYSYEI